MDPVTIVSLINGATSLFQSISKIVEERRRNRELTPEEEAAWDRFKAERMNDPHWQPSTAKKP